MSLSTLRGNVNRVITHVPWFNKAEFDEVAKRAYSDDHGLKRAAYNQMCVWKARNTDLPLAVACTMVLLEAQLTDNESRVEAQTPERDVQLLYLNAIMRFVSHLSDSERTQYAMAYRHNITEWIMNFTDEDAHGNALPSLDLLRSAALVILQWLGDHFWKPQVLQMEDYIIKVKGKQNAALSDVAYFLKVWFSARVYEWGGIERINQLPNEESRVEFLTVLTFWYGWNDYEVSFSNGISEPEQHKLKDIMQKVLNKISDFLDELRESKIVLKKKVINKLLENRGFLSSDVFLEEESPVNAYEEEVISVLAYLWYDVLMLLDSKSMTYELLEALVRVSQNDESVYRSRMAALWLSQLTKMCSHNRSQPQNYWHIDGASNINNTCMLNVLKNLTLSIENNLCTGVHQILLNCLSAKLPTLYLQPLKDLNRCHLARLIKETVHNANKFTSYILPSLLNLCGEHFPKRSKQDLLAKVSVYTNELNDGGSNGFMEDVNSDSVKTIETLGANEEATALVSSDSESEREEGNTNSVRWVPYSGNEDWSTCPLGVTPWQLRSMEKH